MDQFNGFRSAADAARLLDPANAARELYERSPAFQMQQFYENQRQLVDLVSSFSDVVRRINTEQPLLVQEFKLALQGNLAAAQLLDIVRTTELYKYPIPDVIARLSQPAFIDPIMEAFRGFADQYWNGDLDVDPEVGKVLVEYSNKRVLTRAQLATIVSWMITIFTLCDDYHDDRVAAERSAEEKQLAAERFEESQRQFAELREAIEKDCPEYLYAAARLCLRTAPTTESKKLLVLERRTILVLLERQGDWLFVELAEDRSLRGWVSEAFVEDLD